MISPTISYAQSSTSVKPLLWGNDTGLYRENPSGQVEKSWSGGKVKKVIPLSQSPGVSAWALLSDEGIFVSSDLKNWEKRNRGLPEKVIKIYENGKKSFITTIQEIKDFEIDPANGKIMVCAVKDAVYLSQDEGRNWQSLGMPNYRSNGIKAVAVTSSPSLTIFCSHSIYGVYYINPGTPGAKWIEISGGLEKLETTNNPDEISDIAIIPDSQNSFPAVYASQSFRLRLYKLDWERKNWQLIWSSNSPLNAMDSLSAGRYSLMFIRDGGITEIELFSERNVAGPARPRQDLVAMIKGKAGSERLNCIAFEENRFLPPGKELRCLSELWLVDEKPQISSSSALEFMPPNSRRAAGLEGLYLPVNHAMDPASLRPYLDIIEKRKLNMVVIDMKDDYGRLRFTPQNQMTNLGRVFRPVDIDEFLKTMKARGIFTVARIVVFKDPEAASKEGGKYAVWDRVTDKPWEGYYDVRRKKIDNPETNTALVSEILPADDNDFEILRTWYDEKWVDPYSEVVWDYNISVAEELCRRGFDEIQFDYIRFPTDGVNLNDARYRWRDPGMDMDSAILSFLRHARARIKSPISIDIYGANGWYRTGARTGQEVELLSSYVDVICPMYYPSHFEQDFLAHDPPELRPFRIYYQGSLRTHIISRGRVIVRPWAQAFYLNVSYDRKYYSPEYVLLQRDGVRAAGYGGLTYWNNSGRYDDIPE